jgi:hypothetical protein
MFVAMFVSDMFVGVVLTTHSFSWVVQNMNLVDMQGLIDGHDERGDQSLPNLVSFEPNVVSLKFSCNTTELGHMD